MYGSCHLWHARSAFASSRLWVLVDWFICLMLNPLSLLWYPYKWVVFQGQRNSNLDGADRDNEKKNVLAKVAHWNIWILVDFYVFFCNPPSSVSSLTCGVHIFSSKQLILCLVLVVCDLPDQLLLDLGSGCWLIDFYAQCGIRYQ